MSIVAVPDSFAQTHRHHLRAESVLVEAMVDRVVEIAIARIVAVLSHLVVALAGCRPMRARVQTDSRHSVLTPPYGEEGFRRYNVIPHVSAGEVVEYKYIHFRS